jgi:UDP-4-amino-4-deoxy-L-arabinose-oxoglutarate aminotransferase
MYGQMCDIKAIKEILPKDQKISIIEDCAHTFEAKFNGDRPGKYSDVSIFSFYATKNVTCGEGGAIITNDSILFERITQSILHGMSAGAADRFKDGQYKHWEMEHLGTKANLPDLLACFLPDQIRDIDNKLPLREQLAKNYINVLDPHKFRIPKVSPNVLHSLHLFPIGVGKVNRDKVLSVFSEKKIGVTVNYRSVSRMSYYQRKYNLSEKDFPNSTLWGEETISLPLFLGLTETEQNYVIDVLLKYIMPLTG